MQLEFLLHPHFGVGRGLKKLLDVVLMAYAPLPKVVFNVALLKYDATDGTALLFVRILVMLCVSLKEAWSTAANCLPVSERILHFSARFNAYVNYRVLCHTLRS